MKPEDLNALSHAEFKKRERAIFAEADTAQRAKLRGMGYNVPDHPDDHADESDDEAESESAERDSGESAPPAPAESADPIPDYLTAPQWAPIPANVPADARKLIEDARSAANAAYAEARGLFRAWKSR